MTDPKQHSHEDKAYRDDKREERLNPGQNTDGEGSVGAPVEDGHGGAAAKEHPLNRSDDEQAGTERD